MLGKPQLIILLTKLLVPLQSGVDLVTLIHLLAFQSSASPPPQIHQQNDFYLHGHSASAL